MERRCGEDLTNDWQQVSKVSGTRRDIADHLSNNRRRIAQPKLRWRVRRRLEGKLDQIEAGAQNARIELQCVGLPFRRRTNLSDRDAVHEHTRQQLHVNAPAFDNERQVLRIGHVDRQRGAFTEGPSAVGLRVKPAFSEAESLGNHLVSA